ncbi:terminase small subunit [Pollutibacter soli]|uniref:terminase small subunit n=1 Tax=Pollutibacter soli TaxID=3034157 RepID=UPI00301407CB
MSAKKYNSGSDIWAKWVLYKRQCDSGKRKQHASAGKVVEIRDPIVYTLGHFLSYIGVSQPTWRSYRSKPAYREECNQIMEEIEARMARAIVNGEGNTAGLRFALAHNFGWKETASVETKGKIEVVFKRGKTIL